MNAKEVDLFERVEAQLQALYTEISLLSKSKPNDAINKFKLKFTNTVLSAANEILGDKYRPFTDFDLFGEDDVPSNSDVVLILSQYLNSLEIFRADNASSKGILWYWIIDNKISDRRTKNPRKF